MNCLWFISAAKHSKLTTITCRIITDIRMQATLQGLIKVYIFDYPGKPR